MFIPLCTSTRIRRFPFAVAVLVLLNAAAFWVTYDQLEVAVDRWGFHPSSAAPVLHGELNSSRLQTFVTYAFLHAGWIHLLANMCFLIVFGSAAEQRLGSIQFLASYCLLAAIAIAAHTVFITGPALPVIGASGAVSGVLAIYCSQVGWRGRVLCVVPLGFLWFIAEIPSLFFVVVWLALQVDGVQTRYLLTPGHDNISWWSHLGGFAAGLLMGFAFERVSTFFSARPVWKSDITKHEIPTHSEL